MQFQSPAARRGFRYGCAHGCPREVGGRVDLAGKLERFLEPLERLGHVTVPTVRLAEQQQQIQDLAGARWAFGEAAGQRKRAVEIRERLAICGARERAFARFRPIGNRLLRHCGRRIVLRYQLRLPLSDFHKSAFNCLADPAVQKLASASEQILIGRVLNQTCLKRYSDSGGRPCTSRISASASRSSAVCRAVSSMSATARISG